MKDKHVEEKFLQEQLDPGKRSRSFDKDPVFMDFWRICQEKSAKIKKMDSFSSQYAEWTWNIAKTFDEFHSFLKDVPLVVVLKHWVEGAINNPMAGTKAVFDLQRLLEHDLISLSLPNGAPVTLYDMQFRGHQEVIEEIRCVPFWTQAEKEALVRRYVGFSCDLARYTFNYVLPGFDPDRIYAESRLIPYEVFYSFIQFLSERDALIAKVLYFGSPSMEATLSLKVDAIDKKYSSIHFAEKMHSFPKHLIQDLLVHAQKSPNRKKLVFVNLRGEEVERAHLNQSFARASEKMPQGVKITPASLLRFRADSKNLE
jgi:hypothetical protein